MRVAKSIVEIINASGKGKIHSASTTSDINNIRNISSISSTAHAHTISTISALSFRRVISNTSDVNNHNKT